jgi:hypothetical protein
MATVRVSQAGLRLAIVASGAVAWSATGIMSGSALDTEVAAAAWSASATMAAPAGVTKVSAAAFVASASMTAGAVTTRNGAASWSAAATMSASGNRTSVAAAAWTAAATMSGSGALQFTGAVAFVASASLSSSAATIAAATVQLVAVATLGGAGLLLFDANTALVATATWGAGGVTTQNAAAGWSATSAMADTGPVVSPPDFSVGVYLIRRAKTGLDSDGSDVYGDTLTLLYETVTWPRASTENVQGGDLVITGVTMLIRPGVDLGAVDQVLVDGKRYDIDGDPAHYRSPFTGTDPGTVLQLVRATG